MSADEVVEKLKRHFGLGEKPEIRLALYQRLGRIVEDEGEYALQVVAQTVQDAQRATKDKGHYFAFVVMRRLLERRVIHAAEL